ncbi:MAG: insulinase family protein [Clostridiales bacterium]|nr:insulinase family protein [Clostridiales bacterium]
MTEKLTSSILNESYIKIEHKSGLKVYVYPKPEYTSSYAVFGAKFGSVNTTFYDEEGTLTVVPDGIAHYLEHKLFESEEGDAFAKFAATGASANAYTSFDKTMYLFSCTDNFITNLTSLLEFVQSPYFTDETVAKEQGIIAQEIKMYDDSPDWRVMFNLFNALYINHPLKVDLAGTVESISKITPRELYSCYNNFYNLDNMVLVAVGNIDIEELNACLDRCLKPQKPMTAKACIPQEPDGILKSYTEQSFDVSLPIFQLGFKEPVKNALSEKQLAASDVLMYMLFGESSPLYKELEENKLINNSFGFEHMESDTYSCVLLGGESRDPQKAAEIIRAYIKNCFKEGFKKEEFDLALRSVYGNAVASFNSVEGIASIIGAMHFCGREIYKYIDELSKLTLDDINERMKEQISLERCALSVIKPK